MGGLCIGKLESMMREAAGPLNFFKRLAYFIDLVEFMCGQYKTLRKALSHYGAIRVGRCFDEFGNIVVPTICEKVFGLQESSLFVTANGESAFDPTNAVWGSIMDAVTDKFSDRRVVG